MLSCHVCPLVHWLIVFVWRVCKDETKINSAGWIPVTRHISAYFLMQFWNSVFFCSLFVTAVWMSCKCFYVVFVLLFIGWLFFVTSLQGWDKDKFSGLNSRDERHLRLLSDAVLEQRFSFAACLSLRFECLANAFMSCLSSCSLVDCFCVTSLQGWDKDKFSGLNSSDETHLRLLSDAVLEELFLSQLVCHCGAAVLQMLLCLVCPLVHWLIVFVWRVCKDETKINSAGWIPVTRVLPCHVCPVCFLII